MRLKIFGLFLLVQLTALGTWQLRHSNSVNTLQASAAAPQSAIDLPVEKWSNADTEGSSLRLHSATLRAGYHPPNPIPIPPSDSPENKTYKISTRNWTPENQELYDQQTDLIKKMLAVFPSEHTQTLEIVLDYDPTAHRGWGGKGRVILGATTMGSEELIAVLTHEIGHHVDAAVLNASQKDSVSPYHDGDFPLYASDPSISFYNLSWMTDAERKNEEQADSLSGYGATNKHEDFAETYAYYVLHQAEFEFLSKTDPTLKKKYDFMKNVVFRKKTFQDAFTSVDLQKRPWDVTKLSYDLDAFLWMNENLKT